MRPIFLFLFFFPALFSLSQNHVPNSSFEEHADKKVLQWLQPGGQYYHFTEAGKKDGPAVTGKYFNGICMINRVSSEYLEIKLACPLTKGEKYKLSMYVKLDTASMHNYQSVKSIDWLFTSKPMKVDTRVKIEIPPQVTFIFDTVKIFDWTLLTAEYTASGGETYLLIGKFFQDADSIKKVLNSANSDLVYVRKRVVMNERSAIDSLKKYTGEKSKHPMPKMKHKAKSGPGLDYNEYKKEMNKEILDIKSLHKEFKQVLSEKIDSINKKYHVNDYYYDSRFFFDEISVDGKDCDLSTIDIKTLNPGKTISISNIFFETNKYDLLPASFSELDKLVKLMIDNPALRIRIDGYTDNSGSSSANQKLSEQRAKAVMNYLLKKNIAPERLSCKGFGSSKPIVDNTTKEGKEKNRRVEFVILKN